MIVRIIYRIYSFYLSIATCYTNTIYHLKFEDILSCKIKNRVKRYIPPIYCKLLTHSL